MADFQEDEPDRFSSIVSLTLRRFHISANPPFGGGLMLLGHENGDDEDAIEGSEVIPNCKPGIWTSRCREVASGLTECLLYWVAPGTIDLGQSVEDWKKYDEEARTKDASVKLSQIVPEDAKWKRAGSYYDDGGALNIISTEYLTKEAAKKIMFGDSEEEEELDYGYYIETLTLAFMDGEAGNEMYTLGGMSIGQDAIGGPPKIALAEKDGQVIALRMYEIEEEDGERLDGPEEGFTSADDA